MKVETGFPAPAHILRHAETSQRDTVKRLRSLGLGDDVVTGPIGQADIAQDGVDWLCSNDLQRLVDSAGECNFVTKMPKQPREHAPGVIMIFHQQNAQF